MLPTQEQVSSVFPSKDFVKVQQLDIRREGQPISTDDFLRKVLTQDMRGVKVVMIDTVMINAIVSWVNGDFAEAMEGFE